LHYSAVLNDSGEGNGAEKREVELFFSVVINFQKKVKTTFGFLAEINLHGYLKEKYLLRLSTDKGQDPALVLLSIFLLTTVPQHRRVH
jgi:hypothetical protein